MEKFLYGLAILFLIVGLIDASGGTPGSHREIEAGILLLLVPVLGFAGFGVSRASTKKCLQCSERIQKDALKCKHCGSSVA